MVTPVIVVVGDEIRDEELHENVDHSFPPVPPIDVGIYGEMSIPGDEGEIRRPRAPSNVRVQTYAPDWQMRVRSMKDTLQSSPLSTVPRKLRKFYKQQHQLVQDFEDSARLVEGETQSPVAGSNRTRDQSPNFARLVTLAIRLSLGVNVCILVIKVAIAITSGSLSILASALDSVLDLASGIIIFLTERAILRVDPYEYPQGKQRLEPLGLIVLSSLMTMVSVNVIVEGIRRITSDPSPSNLGVLDIILLGSIIIAKSLLYLFCRRLTASPSVAALALDHRNDVLNNLFGVIFAYLGVLVWPYLDPIGAILFSLFVIGTWCHNAIGSMRAIVGASASPQFLQQLTFLAMHHDGRIMQVDTVRAFHFGTNFLVEVDIVLPREMPLELAHDISEGLQMKLELLPEVARAFVHADYEVTHKPEHNIV